MIKKARQFGWYFGESGSLECDMVVVRPLIEEVLNLIERCEQKIQHANRRNIRGSGLK